MPARTRSTIRLRSSSAIAPINDDYGPAQGPAGIDLLPEADELDIDPIQFIEHLEEVLHRPGQPVGSPDQDHIEAAAAGVGHHLIEAGAWLWLMIH